MAINRTLNQIYQFCRNNNICMDENGKMLLWGSKQIQSTLIYQHIKFGIDFYTIAKRPCPPENIELMNKWKEFIGSDFE